MNYTMFVGFDVHKDSITVAVAKKGRDASESLGTITNSPEAIAKLVRKLGRPFLTRYAKAYRRCHAQLP